MLIDFEPFVDEIANEFAGKLNRQRVSALLDVGDHYSIDLRKAANTRLKLDAIKVVGEKSDGSKIKFEYGFKSGVDIWIADNLKGKSSVFKMVKFALTGGNSLKQDVKKWVKRILLTFSIDKEPYSILLNREKTTLAAQLVKGHAKSVTKFEEEELERVFSSGSEADLAAQLQDFFFGKFGYYSLKWTQKASAKDSLELEEANVSWKTIYSSIYLESKDSGSLAFGDQPKKVFQTLLGLELTFPINRLTVKKDKLENSLSKAKLAVTPRKGSGDEDAKRARLMEIVAEIERIQGGLDQETKISAHYQTYDVLIGRLNAANAAVVENADRLRVLYTDRTKTERSVAALSEELRTVQKRIDKGDREIIRLNEYLESSQFFANLDIRHCPSCNQDVDGGQRASDKECVLCHRPAHDQEIDDGSFRSKIEDLEADVAENEKLRKRLLREVSDLRPRLTEIRSSIESGEAVQRGFPDLAGLRHQLEEVEIRINAEKEVARSVGDGLSKLIAERAVIEYQLGSEKEKQNGPSSEALELEIEVLKHAIGVLERKRLENASDILGKLEKLMLAEVGQFGLDSITDVKIDENFEIKFQQDDSYVRFGDIVEGEKLRAKLALYLGLMQLEAEHNVGRHVRLLIIDSPAKEEGDSKYLDGLSGVLKGIEARFGDKLQILIGTAERKLEGVVRNQRIFKADEYVF